jgi:hypothetical protein
MFTMPWMGSCPAEIPGALKSNPSQSAFSPSQFQASVWFGLSLLVHEACTYSRVLETMGRCGTAGRYAAAVGWYAGSYGRRFCLSVIPIRPT